MATTEGSPGGLLASGLERSANVLVLDRAADAGSQACATLSLAPGGEPADALVAVSLTEPPAERLEAWRAPADAELPHELAFVAVGEASRDVASPGGPGEPRISVEVIAGPRNLTALGVGATRQLAAAADDDRRVALCFDSVTALLGANSADRVFRFLHVLTGQAAAADAVAHYHLDPTGQDDQTVNTLVSLFDAVIERTPAGEWQLRTRRRYGE